MSNSKKINGLGWIKEILDNLTEMGIKRRKKKTENKTTTTGNLRIKRWEVLWFKFKKKTKNENKMRIFLRKILW